MTGNGGKMRITIVTTRLGESVFTLILTEVFTLILSGRPNPKIQQTTEKQKYISLLCKGQRPSIWLLLQRVYLYAVALSVWQIGLALIELRPE